MTDWYKAEISPIKEENAWCRKQVQWLIRMGGLLWDRVLRRGLKEQFEKGLGG